jgi:hypothetical protein
MERQGFLIAFFDFCPYTSVMRNRMGRPPKSGDGNLSERLELRVTVDEKTAYNIAAAAEGIERSDWIRAILNKAAKKAARAKEELTGS